MWYISSKFRRKESINRVKFYGFGKPARNADRNLRRLKLEYVDVFISAPTRLGPGFKLSISPQFIFVYFATAFLVVLLFFIYAEIVLEACISLQHMQHKNEMSRQPIIGNFLLLASHSYFNLISSIIFQCDLYFTGEVAMYSSPPMDSSYSSFNDSV